MIDEDQVSKSEQAAKRLFALDDKMQQNYAVTQRMVGEMQSPVILAMFNGVGGKYILRRHGREVAVEPVPELYQQMKSVSHTIVGVYEIVSPYFDSPEDGNWRPKLTEFNQMLKDGLATLDQVGMPSEVEQHCRTILEGGIKFTGNALKTGTFSADDYSAYTKSVWPSIAANIQLAGKLQVDHFEDLITKWRKEMGEEEWSRLYAIVGTAWAMRRENVHFQILAQMMGREAVNDRLILAESIPDVSEDQLLMLLGRIINDRGLATLVFGDEYRMDVELIGEATRAETEKKATPHHPALGTDWMPYEEHKLPNEE
ncbi:hypothetical protein [Microbulbifer rhizosphaerae]|uniref:hypothetical protein n=1 Tax=Microbulbifer rhizosphaerae TaxID=1562603 RepID=UPI00161F4AB0|nr:hypothetical protein [Microbulbifer rhizosphaerae]